MSYKSSAQTIKLPNNDHDITLVLPCGERITLQYRVESPSLDLCFSRPTGITVWEDGDLTPARLNRNGDGVIEQICLAVGRQ